MDTKTNKKALFKWKSCNFIMSKEGDIPHCNMCVIRVEYPPGNVCLEYETSAVCPSVSVCYSEKVKDKTLRRKDRCPIMAHIYCKYCNPHSHGSAMSTPQWKVPRDTQWWRPGQIKGSKCQQVELSHYQPPHIRHYCGK